MKEQLIVKNFGPIKDIQLDLNKVNLFIGPQGSGKSTLAKLVAICKDFNFAQNPDLNLFHHYGLKDYFDKNTYFEFQSSSWNVKYKNDELVAHINSDIYAAPFDNPSVLEAFTNSGDKINPLLENQVKSIKSENSEKNTIDNSNIPYHLLLTPDIMSELVKQLFITNPHLVQILQESINKIISQVYYIPTERILTSTISPYVFNLTKAGVHFPYALLDFSSLYEDARNHISKLNIPYLKVNYHYKNNTDFLVINDDKEILLSDGSSGMQMVVPVLVILKHLETKDHPKFFIVEEPELNLYPTTQKSFVAELINKCTQNKDQLIITTHSPYILAYLNTLIFAYKTAQKHPTKQAEIAETIPEKSWINPSDFNAYFIDSAGTMRSIVDTSTGMIDENELDEASELIGAEFDDLYMLYKQEAIEK